MCKIITTPSGSGTLKAFRVMHTCNHSRNLSEQTRRINTIIMLYHNYVIIMSLIH